MLQHYSDTATSRDATDLKSFTLPLSYCTPNYVVLNLRPPIMLQCKRMLADATLSHAVTENNLDLDVAL